ncbi:MAG: chromosome partitioning protein [Alphaproteobacteria bacterium]|nr:chromosome partitioning protein [Alphaproteobacteria bacterium]
MDRIAPTRAITKDVLRSRKYRTILASVRDVGIIEPLAVFPDKGGSGAPRYILHDGLLRLAALREIGEEQVLCLVSTDDESFTYNRRINRLSAIQEHKMIVRAIERGVSQERIAVALDVDVRRVRERENMLHGIAPEAVELLKDKMVSIHVFGLLRKMKPLAQIETAEMMISANRYTITYAKVLLAGMPPEKLLKPEKKADLKGVSPEDIARMEREMERLQHEYRNVEETLGDTMFTLVVAKGYLNKLLKNETVADYLDRHHASLLGELRTVMDAIGADTRDLERE